MLQPPLQLFNIDSLLLIAEVEFGKLESGAILIDFDPLILQPTPDL